MPGPVPKRSEERRRRNKENGPTAKVEARGIVERPDADPNWHPIAVMLYDSLAESGQAVFMEPSDWAFAWSVCEDLSYYKNAPGGKRSGQMLATLYSAMTDLLVTEGARRRVRVEIDRGADLDVVEPTVLDDYRDLTG